MIDAFQSSCQSARENLTAFKQLKEENEHNDTSVWNSSGEREEDNEINNEVERALDDTLQSDGDKTLSNQGKIKFQNFILKLKSQASETVEQTVETETVEVVPSIAKSIEIESSELDELVSQSAIIVDDDERPGKRLCGFW